MGKTKKQKMQQEEEDIVFWFEELAENAALAQTQTLRCILELNHGTEYLRKWLGVVEEVQHMEAAQLESLYTSVVPLSSHADLEPYIQRVAEGDSSSVLTHHPITTLSLSSGTTDGRPKYVPFTHFSAQSTLQIFRLAAAYRARVYPVARSGGRILEFIYSSKQFKTKGGVSVGTATTHYYASEEFKMKQRSSKCYTCSPQEVIAAGDYKQSTYCHLLLGLQLCDQVEFVTSTFAYSIIQALGALEELWEELVEDIRRGSLSTTRVKLPKVRRAVLRAMQHHSSKCEQQQQQCEGIEGRCRELEKSGWRRAIPVLWPNAKYVYSIMTGSMLPYLTKLRHYAGEVPLVGAEYGSTECWIGVNLYPSSPPEKVTFAVVPSFSYLEFIPLYRQQHTGTTAACDDFFEADPLPLSKVKVGQEYELVLTTFTGLYRYRLGDVVEVAGFYRTTPRLNFICRRKLILSINIDKNTEKDLQLVVECASQQLTGAGTELVDFTSHADLSTNPGHYVIFWEVRGQPSDDVMDRCCLKMDLAFADHGYVVSRKSGSIGPLELRVVEEGTFTKFLDYYIANGAAMSQFKTPRCTANPALLAILHRCTLRRFWSTAYL